MPVYVAFRKSMHAKEQQVPPTDDEQAAEIIADWNNRELSHEEWAAKYVEHLKDKLYGRNTKYPFDCLHGCLQE